MTGETIVRVGPQQYRCTECGGESSTRSPNHELDCPVVTEAIDEFDDLEYGDTVRYVGPDELEDGWAAPRDYAQPFAFQHVSVGGTVTFLTRFGGKKRYRPEHPARRRDYWEVVDDG